MIGEERIKVKVAKLIIRVAQVGDEVAVLASHTKENGCPFQ